MTTSTDLKTYNFSARSKFKIGAIRLSKNDEMFGWNLIFTIQVDSRRLGVEHRFGKYFTTLEYERGDAVLFPSPYISSVTEDICRDLKQACERPNFDRIYHREAIILLAELQKYLDTSMDLDIEAVLQHINYWLKPKQSICC